MLHSCMKATKNWEWGILINKKALLGYLLIPFSLSLSLFLFVSLMILCSVAQLCLTLCDSMDCSPLGSSVCEDTPGKSTGVGCHALLQGVSLTQGSNSGLPHCRWFFRVWATEKPKNIGVGSLYLLQGNLTTQESNPGLLHCRRVLHHLSYPGNPLNVAK